MEYIDLGVPSGTLWATCNIGASRPEEYGDYLNFDEAQEFSCPSKEQFEELIEDCSWIWSKLNDVNGYLISSKVNKNSLFLPAAGCRIGTVLNGAGTYGYYWSSLLSTDNSNDAWYLYFNSGSRYMYDYLRDYGQSMRTVKNP